MIHVRNLSKVFRIPHAKKKTLYHNMLSVVSGSYDYEELFALNGVSFDIREGNSSESWGETAQANPPC